MNRALIAVLFVTACSGGSGAHDAPPGGGDAPLAGDDAPTPDAPVGGVDANTTDVAPMLVTSFPGESGAAGSRNCGRSGGTTCKYKDHADASIASDGTFIVEGTGQSITVYDAVSGAQLAQTDAAAFVTAAGGMAPSVTGVNDPWVDWNEFAHRWVVAIPTDKQDFVIVSATADPRGAWSGAALTATNHGDVTIKLAHDRNGEYLGEYPFDGNGASDPNTAGLSWYCFAIPTAEMAWTGAFAPAHQNQRDCAYEARPVMDHDPSKADTAPFYFLGRTCAPGTCQNSTNFAMGLIVHRGTWSGTSVTFDSLGEGGMDRIVDSGFLYTTPINASQGSSATVAMTESHRVMAAEQRGATLYGVIGSGPCTSGCGAQGADAHDILFYVAVDVGSYPTLALADHAKLASATLDFAYPGLAIDGHGNVGISAMCVGATQPMSTCAWGRGATAAPGVFAGPAVLFAGTTAYTCNSGTQVGTGTYANLVVDGGDARYLWAVEQDAESATSCQWTTRIAQFELR